MPGVLVNREATKKRKRTQDGTEKRRVAKRRDSDSDNGDDQKDEILLLESQILESRKHYKNIERLLKIFKDGKSGEAAILPAVVLCRVFSRLLAGEKMVKSKKSKPEAAEDADWLKSQFKVYISRLCSCLSSEDGQMQSTSLKLLMRLVQLEVSQEGTRGEQAWRSGAFLSTVRALISSDKAEAAREEFLEEFLEENDDVRFFTFHAITNLFSPGSEPSKGAASLLTGAISLLSQVEGIPDSEDQIEDWYGPAPETPKHQLLSLSAHRKQAQEAWLAVFSQVLSKDQRKAVLNILTQRIAPWFTRPETLMDFLTDSYNEGGATSLLALSGVFYLIQQRNLDYPQFYTKLYSLLDEGILHSKHRSRFFRLLDTFMMSSHLPAALVASFIKRLSRLALHAPPGGIVVVVPWIYNMLKKHPSCTFMIHRETRDPQAQQLLEDKGMDDPFDMTEMDPMETDAIESSLWEIETLQSHYHPNVATLTKIISEQFTKRDYSLEDFLDHSYQGLIDAELGKDMKRAPVVEYEIPKRIFTTEEGELDRVGGLLQQAISSS